MGEKSKVVCINGVKKERNMGEVHEYKYLGITVKAGLNRGFKSVWGQIGGCKWSPGNGKICSIKVEE